MLLETQCVFLLFRGKREGKVLYHYYCTGNICGLFNLHQHLNMCTSVFVYLFVIMHNNIVVGAHKNV